MRRLVASINIALLVGGFLSLSASTSSAAVPTAGQCFAVNATHVAIADSPSPAVDSPVTVADCDGNAVAGSVVEVHIVHPYSGDLVVDLVAPDASAYRLPTWVGGPGANIHQAYTVNLTSEVAGGVWKLRVQDVRTGNVGRIDSWALDLLGTAGLNASCEKLNGTDVAIVDNTTVVSTNTITGCDGNAAGASTVAVVIKHSYTGDAIVDLIAPDGTVYNLFNRAIQKVEYIDQLFTINLAGETASGTWKLRVQDVEYGDTGYIDTWKLNLRGLPGLGACVAENRVDVTIPDLATAGSSAEITGCNGNAAAASTIQVFITHAFAADLIVNLIAPDGTVYNLHNRTHYMATSYTVGLAGETANGTWELQVQDVVLADTGFIDRWMLNLATT